VDQTTNTPSWVPRYDKKLSKGSPTFLYNYRARGPFRANIWDEIVPKDGAFKLPLSGHYHAQVVQIFPTFLRGTSNKRIWETVLGLKIHIPPETKPKKRDFVWSSL
jgi:hypothetical protein